MPLSLLCLFCFPLLLTAAANAQTPGVPSSHLDHLHRGVNIGRFSDKGLENDPCCKTKADVAVIQSMGFDHVRIIVKPKSMADFSKPITAIGGQSLLDLDSIVQNFVDAKVGVILAITLDSTKDEFPDIKDKLGNDKSTFDDYFGDFWKCFASRYSTHSDLVFFETLNEPDLDDTTWSRLQEKLVTKIRDGAAQNTIIATGAHGIINGLLGLDPLPDENVIYSFHYYEPYSFTNQGETWAPGYLKLLTKGSVTYPYQSLDSAQNAATQIKDLTDHLSAMHDMMLATKDRITNDINEVAKWKQKNGVTVICDEFGAIITTNLKDRENWTRDVREELEDKNIGMGWTFWDYNSSNFGLLPLQAGADLVSALGVNPPPAPH
jgi:aryl-phospho-beta-D-glucosidase BglC (GH1 family)